MPPARPSGIGLRSGRNLSQFESTRFNVQDTQPSPLATGAKPGQVQRSQSAQDPLASILAINESATPYTDVRLSLSTDSLSKAGKENAVGANRRSRVPIMNNTPLKPADVYFMTPPKGIRRQRSRRSSVGDRRGSIGGRCTSISASTVKKQKSVPFSAMKSAKKIKRLTPPRPKTVKKKKVPKSSKKNATKKKRVIATDSKTDPYVLRSSEHKPSPFQVELPSYDTTLIHARICHVMDQYMEIGGVGFDFNDLVDIDDDDVTTKECDLVLAELQEVVSDIKVEGFTREYNDEGRAEACILSSHSLRQFIVCFRGSSSRQAKPVRGEEKYAKLSDEDDSSILHAKHPVAVMPTFREAYFAGDLEENVFYMLNRLASLNPFCDVVMTGHSFGSSTATIASARYASLCPQIRVSCHVFGSPKIGGEEFCQWVHSLPNLRVIRIERATDAYTFMPEGSSWRHAGHSIRIPPSQTASLSSAILETVGVGAPATTEAESAGSSIVAYRFDKGKPGPDNFLKKGVDELSKIIWAAGKADREIAAYIEELVKYEGKWVDDFAGMVGEGVKSAFDDEERLVV